MAHASSDSDASADDFLDAEDIEISTSTATAIPTICDHTVPSPSAAAASRLRNGRMTSSGPELDPAPDENDDATVDFELKEEFRLHRAIFERSPANTIANMLKDWHQRAPSKSFADLVSVKDRHGNTPLHLAVMTGQREIIELLLFHDAQIKSRNLQGWTPLDEAISYGDRTSIRTLLKKGRKQARTSMETRRPKLIKALSLIEDFEMELKWEFYSWVPLVKRFLPSDTCKLTKKGSSIRLDTTLVDFSDRSWQRGDITFLFSGAAKRTSAESKGLTVLDNEMKVYQSVRYSGHSTDIEEDIDILMSSDIIYPQMSTKSITFTRAQAGWWFSRYNKTERVGQFEADFYNINGLTVDTRKRREHLSEEDVQSNKQLIETLKKSMDSKDAAEEMEAILEMPNGAVVEEEMSPEKVAKNGPRKGAPPTSGRTAPTKNGSMASSNSSGSLRNGCSTDGSSPPPQPGFESEDEEDFESSSDTDARADDLPLRPNQLRYRRRKSLPPPVVPPITWTDYVNAPKGQPPCLARPLKTKSSVRTFKATLAMSQEFPLSIESLMNVLEVVAPFKHFKKLSEFIQMNLPPGFPVKIDIPVIPAVLARVTFLNFTFNDKIPDHLFDIPADYTEDPSRFPDI